jgi:hypothetical protein
MTISYIDLVIFAHVAQAQARVGEENFQYYEGSKAKSGNIAQQLDLLPETSKKLFKFH